MAEGVGSPVAPAELTWALVMAAMFSGLVAPMVGRRSRLTMNVALMVHVSVAITGFVAYGLSGYLGWAWTALRRRNAPPGPAE